MCSISPPWAPHFAFRTIVQAKRFIFWDDYRPVEFAQEKTVPVAAFLSLLIGKHTEVQVSQSFHDGNLDVQWKRGVVFTAKEEGLWIPTTKICSEDVRHLRNRVQEYRFTEVVTSLKDVESCAPCMARWILKWSEAAVPAALPVHTAQLAPVAPMSLSTVTGFPEMMFASKLTGPVVGGLLSDILALGAVDIAELCLKDWQALPSWKMLRPLEMRRLATAIP